MPIWLVVSVCVAGCSGEPAAPRVEWSERGLVVAWTPVDGTTHYHVRRDGERLTPAEGMACHDGVCRFTDSDFDGSAAAKDFEVLWRDRGLGIFRASALPTGARRYTVTPVDEDVMDSATEVPEVAIEVRVERLELKVLEGDAAHVVPVPVDAEDWPTLKDEALLPKMVLTTSERSNHGLVLKATFTPLPRYALRVAHVLVQDGVAGDPIWSEWAAERPMDLQRTRAAWFWRVTPGDTTWRALNCTHMLKEPAVTCEFSRPEAGLRVEVELRIQTMQGEPVHEFGPMLIDRTVTQMAAGRKTICTATVAQDIVECGPTQYGPDVVDASVGVVRPELQWPSLKHVAVLASGPSADHTCVISGHGAADDEAGRVWCWGDNRALQLGVDPSETVGYPKTTSLVRAGRASDLKARAVAPGATSTCAVRVARVGDATGDVVCWGTGGMGELGYGRIGASHEPQQVLVSRDMPLNGMVAVTAGRHHACALDAEGRVWCWGDNRHFQLGRPRPAKGLFAAVVEGLAPAVEVKAGADFTCARHPDGRVSCWGDNRQGQLGRGDGGAKHASPERVGDIEAVVLAMGEAHGCAITRGESEGVWCWGSNDRAQLGRREVPLAATPVELVTRAAVAGDAAWSPQLVAGGATTCVLNAGRMHCWGGRK